MNNNLINLRNTFTSYWNYLPLKTGCKLHIFDYIYDEDNTLGLLVNRLNSSEQALSVLLNALVHLNTLKKKNGVYQLTEIGELLTEKHPQSIKYSCILWGEEHLTSWQQLELTILNGKPSFEQVYKESFFDYLKTTPNSNLIYHKAMYEYARDDYRDINLVIDFSHHSAILDIGGGLGALLDSIYKHHPQALLFLLETSNVIDLFEKSKTHIHKITGDFFDEIPLVADAFVMSRILHDWDDEKVSLILKNIYKSLPEKGKLYIIENMKEKVEDGAHLLNLNMKLMCDSFERTTEEYKNIIESEHFKVDEIKSLNTLQSILIVSKI